MPTALIVEDEPEANKLLAMLVQLRGYQTDSALNGRDALAIVEEHPPDIIFLDLMLPDITGYDVCAHLKSQKKTTLIPVVMVTARVTLDNRLHSYALGADQYVPKPYTPDQIFDAIADADEWRALVANRPTDRMVAIGSRDDGETLRQLARLRGLLLATTPLDAPTVDHMALALRDLANCADQWGQNNGLSDIAQLEYRQNPEHVEFRLRDVSGWYRDREPSLQEFATELLKLGRFDQVGLDPTEQTLTFTKSFAC